MMFGVLAVGALAVSGFRTVSAALNLSKRSTNDIATLRTNPNIFAITQSPNVQPQAVMTIYKAVFPQTSWIVTAASSGAGTTCTSLASDASFCYTVSGVVSSAWSSPTSPAWSSPTPTPITTISAGSITTFSGTQSWDTFSLTAPSTAGLQTTTLYAGSETTTMIYSVVGSWSSANYQAAAAGGGDSSGQSDNGPSSTLSAGVKETWAGTASGDTFSLTAPSTAGMQTTTLSAGSETTIVTYDVIGGVTPDVSGKSNNNPPKTLLTGAMKMWAGVSSSIIWVLTAPSTAGPQTTALTGGGETTTVTFDVVTSLSDSSGSEEDVLTTLITGGLGMWKGTASGDILLLIAPETAGLQTTVLSASSETMTITYDVVTSKATTG